MIEAIRRLIYGPAAPEPEKVCADCKHCLPGVIIYSLPGVIAYEDAVDDTPDLLCAKLRHFVHGYPLGCTQQRLAGGACGHQALFFEPKLSTVKAGEP